MKFDMPPGRFQCQKGLGMALKKNHAYPNISQVGGLS
jgi:hypothetical protein